MEQLCVPIKPHAMHNNMTTSEDHSLHLLYGQSGIPPTLLQDYEKQKTISTLNTCTPWLEPKRLATN